MIRLREPDKEFVQEHLKDINHISQLMYTYMLSPKDAFRMFDKANIGILKLDYFKDLVT